MEAETSELRDRLLSGQQEVASLKAALAESRDTKQSLASSAGEGEAERVLASKLSGLEDAMRAQSLESEKSLREAKREGTAGGTEVGVGQGARSRSYNYILPAHRHHGLLTSALLR